MKRKVKVLLHSKHANIFIKDNGDCFDMTACEDCKVTVNKAHLISLGLSMKLPSGCIAKVYDRSSTPGKYGVSLANSVGIIDNSYCGNGDVWRYQAQNISGQTVLIKEGDRICQFEICLSQKATVWQKIKWLFTSGYKFEFVENLSDTNRGGFGKGTQE